MSMLFVDQWGFDAKIINDEGVVAPVAPPHHADFNAIADIEAELEALGYIKEGDAAVSALKSIVQERRGLAQ